MTPQDEQKARTIGWHCEGAGCPEYLHSWEYWAQERGSDEERDQEHENGREEDESWIQRNIDEAERQGVYR
jgi:hypothetical protein